MNVKAGSVNVSVYYYIVQDASATNPGEPVTGLLFSDIETGGSASYVRQGAASTDLTLITLASASATHADGGFILVDDTANPGLYRCDYPDAAFVTGVDQTFCQIVIASANNAVAAPILIDIDDNVDQTADNDTKLTTLLARIIGTLAAGTHNPATAAQIAVLSDWINGGRLDLILDIIANDTTTDIPALIAALNDIAATDIVSSGPITTSAGAVSNVTTLATLTGHTAQTGDSFPRLGAPAGATISADIATKATPAEVNLEVVDVLTVDTFAEPSSVVGATASIQAMVSWIKVFFRNKMTQTATTNTLRNDADSGNIATSVVSDDGSTFTKDEYI